MTRVLLTWAALVLALGAMGQSCDGRVATASSAPGGGGPRPGPQPAPNPFSAPAPGPTLRPALPTGPGLADSTRFVRGDGPPSLLGGGSGNGITGRAINDGFDTPPGTPGVPEVGDLRLVDPLSEKAGTRAGAARPRGASEEVEYRQRVARRAAAASEGQFVPADAFLRGRVAIPATAVDPRAAEDSRRSELSARSAAHKIKMGDYAGALADAGLAARGSPAQSSWGRYLQAVAFNRLRRFPEAEAAAREAIRQDSENVRSYEALAWAQLQQGHSTEAERTMSGAILLDPANPHAYLVRALAYERLGDRERMFADLRLAASRDQRYGGALRHAEAGGRLFDPEARDSWALLDAIPAPRSRGFPWPWAALLVAAVGAAFGLRRRLAAWGKGLSRLPAASGPEVPILVRAGDGERAERLLGGKYRLARIIGRGGMGEVWEARDTSLDRAVAVKRVAGGGPAESEARALTRKEALAAASLQHPNIVSVYEVIEEEETLHLVFELVVGKTVQQLLVEEKRLPPARIRDILLGVCAGLEYAHGRGVVHRDLKPANILVTAEGSAKVTDFGIARRAAPGEEEGRAAPAGSASGVPVPPQGSSVAAPRALPLPALRTETILGTPAYMAPEALEGVVSAAGDVFALGVCLYEMATGHHPYHGDDLFLKLERAYPPASRLAPALPPAFDAFVASALHPEASLRVPSAQAFALGLGRIIGA